MLPTLNLDDLTYQQILDILRAHLPGDEWSDHNPSDPGITLLEMLAWLGEMDLYRMNRIPQAHRDKFLKLVIDPPVPVAVRVTLQLNKVLTADFVLPPGLRLASDYSGGRRTLLETFAPSTVSASDHKTEVLGRAVRDLAVPGVTEVTLGISDGTANQAFPIPDRPVLLDFGSVLGPYNPNPRVRVGGTEWTLQPFLLTPVSQANPTPPNHFMVEDFEGRVRFGDDTFGAIPPAGAAITLIACQILEGPEALVAAGAIRHVVVVPASAGLAPTETLTVLASKDAEGGENFFAADDPLESHLAEFRNPTRLITAADFERIATHDFNQFQTRFNQAVGRPLSQDLVQRTTALMNRKPPALDVPAPGHVTLMVLPVFDEATFDAAPLATKTTLATPSPDLADRLKAFLEPRRLLTTRLDVIGPDLLAVSAQTLVVVDSQSNTTQMAKAIEARLRQYLGITQGYDDGRGWPLGRTVRRSQLYRVLEDLPGVDHVESLVLSPADATGDVPLTARQLPVWDTLTVQVKRV
jgi:hypothetical protein